MEVTGNVRNGFWAVYLWLRLAGSLAIHVLSSFSLPRQVYLLEYASNIIILVVIFNYTAGFVFFLQITSVTNKRTNRETNIDRVAVLTALFMTSRSETPKSILYCTAAFYFNPSRGFDFVDGRILAFSIVMTMTNEVSPFNIGLLQ